MEQTLTSSDASNAATSLLTLSFRGDYELCQLLCDTVDRFVPPDLDHILAVPSDDLRLFSNLANSRRQIISQDSLLPPWLIKVPLPSAKWRARLRLPRRNIYLSLKGAPVRGWIAQQIMKFSAAAQCKSDVLMHIDSDAAFIRRWRAGTLYQADKVRLLRIPGAGQSPMHQPWHRAASKLLGLPTSDYHGADYIDNCITWRPSIVRSLLSHIETQSGRDWRLALARIGEFSEYTLYGVYCDLVLGLPTAGHFGAPLSLSNTIWSETSLDRDGALAILPHHIAVGIQSTMSTTNASRRLITESAITQAATQDESSTPAE